jgi:hypothetical protein
VLDLEAEALVDPDGTGRTVRVDAERRGRLSVRDGRRE